MPREYVGAHGAKTMIAARNQYASARRVHAHAHEVWECFDAIGFRTRYAEWQPDGVENALAIVMGDLAGGVPLLRIHSQCFNGRGASARCAAIAANSWK